MNLCSLSPLVKRPPTRFNNVVTFTHFNPLARHARSWSYPLGSIRAIRTCGTIKLLSSICYSPWKGKKIVFKRKWVSGVEGRAWRLSHALLTTSSGPVCHSDAVWSSRFTGMNEATSSSGGELPGVARLFCLMALFTWPLVRLTGGVRGSRARLLRRRNRVKASACWSSLPVAMKSKS